MHRLQIYFRLPLSVTPKRILSVNKRLRNLERIQFIAKCSSIYGSLSKNGGIQKGKIIKKYCPKFHFFSNIFINTNMEKIYGKYVQFKNMYNVSIVNYMDGTLAKMSVQSQTNFLIKNRQFKEFSKFKGVPLEILLKTLMGMNLGLFRCGTCKKNTLKIDVQ